MAFHNGGGWNRNRKRQTPGSFGYGRSIGTLWWAAKLARFASAMILSHWQYIQY